MSQPRCSITVLLALVVGITAGCARTRDAVVAAGTDDVGKPAAPRSVEGSGVAPEALFPDTVALAIAATVDRSHGIGDLWPGYRLPSEPFALLADSGRVVLVADRTPRAGTPIAARLLPPELRQRAYLLTLPGVEPNTFGVPIEPFADGDTVWAVKALGRDRFRQLNFLFHEHFHLDFQDGRRFVSVPEDRRRVRFREPLVEPALLTPGFRTAAERERRLLLQALSTETVDSLRVRLRAYLALRRERIGGSVEVLEVERRMERNEGTATYVGCLAAAIATTELPRGVECIRRELEVDLETAYGNMPEADAILMRWRLYGTGAALALLLDRLHPAWKPLVAAGMHLDQLVAQSVGFDPTAEYPHSL